MNEEEEEDDEDEEDRYRTSHSKSPDDDKENMEEHSHGGSMVRFFSVILSQINIVNLLLTIKDFLFFLLFNKITFSIFFCGQIYFYQ